MSTNINRICPSCGGINTPFNVSISEYHSYDRCSNILSVRKILGFIPIKIKCGSINSGNELGAEFDNWIYEKMGVTALKAL